MGILNVRDLEGNFTKKNGHIVMATKDLWGKNSKIPYLQTFVSMWSSYMPKHGFEVLMVFTLFFNMYF